MADRLAYPTSRTVDQVDIYHGVSVPDPYRWLEDANATETADWIAAQNQLTFDYLAQIPARSPIYDRMLQLWDYEKLSVPWKRGDRYFYYKNDGLQNQSVLYTLDRLDGEPRVLLDPNRLSDDGTVALSGIAFTQDGSLMAYGLSAAGSDWQTWRVRSVATGEDLPDRLDWVKFSRASWTPDNRGFFYSRYDEPNAENQFQETNYFQKLYYHELGTEQAADRLIYERPDQPEWGFGGTVSDDGSYLLIAVWKGTESKNLLFVKDLRQPDSPVRELVGDWVGSFGFIDNDGAIGWFETNWQAPMGRVVAIDLDATSTDWQSTIQEVIPEATYKLDAVSTLNDGFVVEYLQDARSAVQFFNLQGQFQFEIELPGLGSIGGFQGKRGDRETFYSFTSYTTPTRIYRYDFASQTSQLFREPTVAFNPEDYETRQVFYHSKDGTKIPLFISHKKGLELTGDHPTILYGYGGFNVSLTPVFSVSNLVWMEMGGIYAVANLRGGGEYGEAWHEAGTKLQKQNVFDDFIAAAEWLIANQYTKPQRLAISGGSNGGLLVGACLIQRPDLFGAALPAVGVMDMLRFPQFTIGWAWCSDYGSPENEAEFQALYAYSPLHNLRSGTAYPATLVTTADRDDRVVPAHSFKFTAALQAAQGGDAPTLIRIETKAGHGAGKPTTKIVEEASDKLAFLVKTLDFQPRLVAKVAES
ncbi:prolyl oligopeptidase family protein [Limnothrix sp. PR1529]|uniref:prolyl oligopeptidase family serine peptidase n=1 Tax=Limnothrix sp. PR1529 TaxID=1704291 RepID=UPI000A57C93E|nr:prolyl oligopeptidase family serine peptidase [Limnothrix sp. PR1529]